MTVADLIDYLGQFEPQTVVVMSEDDVTEPCEFIALDSLSFDSESVERQSPVQFAQEIVEFVFDWATDPDDPEFLDEDIAVNGYDEHNRARIATDLARAKFGATVGDVPPRV